MRQGRGMKELTELVAQLPGGVMSGVAKWRVRRWLILLGLSLSAAGVSSQPVQENPAPPPYQVVTDVQQTMAWIVFPAADVVWDSAGTIITAQGSEELAPTTDQGWDEVVRAAAVLTEAGNLLMMPGRAAGDDWLAYSRELIEAGKLAMKAAEAQDDEALFDAGGKIYEVCRGCHDKYWEEVDKTR